MHEAVFSFEEFKHVAGWIIGALVSFLAMLGIGKFRDLDQRLRAVESGKTANERTDRLELDVKHLHESVEQLGREVSAIAATVNATDANVRDIRDAIMHAPCRPSRPRTTI